MKDLGIKRISSTPYHPQSNGKLGTLHKFLKPTLKKMCAEDQDNWDDYIKQVLGTYRGVPNLTTESPFFLVYGRDGNQPLHQLLQPLTRFLGDPESALLCLNQHRLSLSIAKKYLDDHRFLTAEKMTERAEPGFKVGDRVYFKNKTPGKWDLKWRAGYRIIWIEHKGCYLHIKNQAIGKIRSCNVKDIVLEPISELWNVNPEFGMSQQVHQPPRTTYQTLPLIHTLHKQAVHMNTVNSEAQHSQFDFCFRFLLLHILAQGEKIESVLFQPILVAYPTRHSWIISTHINLGTLNRPMHMFNRQKNIVREMISKLRNHPEDAIEPLQPLQVELDNLHSLFMAYKPVFSSTMSILQMQPSFDGKPIPPSGRNKQSLLPFFGSALKWLTGTATTKDIKHIKKRISSLIKTQESQWKTMVHIVSILNLTHYETQVNRQWINIILKELTKSNEDIRALFNITNQLATQVQAQNIVLPLQAMLTNLGHCLHFMKQLANHVLEYIDTATTGTLTPHLIPVPDLQKMLYQIESELSPNMHLPIPSSDPLHFYRYLQSHVLVEENQFLLLLSTHSG